MKVTIQLDEDGCYSTVCDPKVATASDALLLCCQALLAVGFHPESVDEAIIAAAEAKAGTT